jgi:hypothetical protein
MAQRDIMLLEANFYLWSKFGFDKQKGYAECTEIP